MASLDLSQSQSSPKRRGQPKQRSDKAAKSRAKTAQKNKEREAAKRLILNGNGGAAYFVGASARLPHGTPGRLLLFQTKVSNSSHQSSSCDSSSGTAKAHVETAEAVWPQSP
jgi:hypothetical protein